MIFIHDEASLYDMFSCASRSRLIKLYVEHSNIDWLRDNNKLADINFTIRTGNVNAPREVGGDSYEEQHDQRYEDYETSSAERR